jgi:tetratricopeptide (TPR) repeat protein
MSEWNHFMEDCDSLIRAGQSQQVIPLLLGHKVKDISRAQAERFAYFHYRVGLFTRGLQILSPIVHPAEVGASPPNEKELTAYAVLLIKIGAVLEAQNILSKVSSKIPEVSLYRAFAAQAEWDYANAIPHLRKYLAQDSLLPYERAIGEVNLAAALISEDESQESRALLLQLFEKAKANHWTLIYKNAQELLGQLSLVVGNSDEAHRLLTEAVSKENYRDTGVFDFFIDKWRAIVDLRRDPESTSAQDGLHLIRQRAIEIKHWESVRECDRVSALALHDQSLLDQVYFGSPFPAYRKRLLRDASWFTPSATFIWGTKDAVIFDLATAQSDNSAVSLKAGHALHRALTALAGDRYKPLFVGQLFSRTYPGEHFIADFSEGRVSTVISRLRNWTKEHQLPLVFDSKDQFFRLSLDEAGAAAGIRFTSDVHADAFDNPMATHLLRLQTKMETSTFSSNQVAESLSISKSTAVRLLGWGVKEGKLKTIGINKNKKYGFAA